MSENQTKTFDPRRLRLVNPGMLAELTGIPVSNAEITDEPARLFIPCNTDFGIEEIVVVPFVHNGNEGAAVSAPIVRKVIDA